MLLFGFAGLFVSHLLVTIKISICLLNVCHYLLLFVVDCFPSIKIQYIIKYISFIVHIDL